MGNESVWFAEGGRFRGVRFEKFYCISATRSEVDLPEVLELALSKFIWSMADHSLPMVVKQNVSRFELSDIECPAGTRT